MTARLVPLGLVLLLAAPGHATVLKAWSLEERIAHADSVLLGRVTGERVYRVDGTIVTDSTIAVERVIFGTSRATVTISQLGGTIGEETILVAGTARLGVGDEVVVIVKRDSGGRDRLVGMSLGAFQVVGQQLRQTIDVPLMRRDGRMLDPPGRQVLDMARVLGAADDVRRAVQGAR